ncbi:reverse transcriptase domain-containing protein [Tanacetum coccineum]
MADHLRPMEELLRIPILGIEDAIVVPAVLADQFELKPELLDFVSNNSFFGLENDDPHSHIRRFYQITRTLRLNQVPDDVVKLILFPFSLKGAAELWLENEPPCSITSWDDLVSKFLTRFYPHSNTREQDEELEPETITEVVEIASSQSTPLVPPPDTPPLSGQKPKEDPKPNPHQPSIPYPSRLKEENFQALENPTGSADHFVYRIDIVDSLCDKDSDSLVEETNILLSHFDDSPLECETFSFDIEEKSSGSTTAHSDYSLPDYEAFYFDDDHIEEKSSGSTTTHSDFSLPGYDSFIF